MTVETPDLQHRHAIEGLAALVHAEYPADLSLAEIAETWGPAAGLTRAQVDAIAALERRP